MQYNKIRKKVRCDYILSIFNWLDIEKSSQNENYESPETRAYFL